MVKWCIFLNRYTPQTVDLETKFRPFIPEYIPAGMYNSTFLIHWHTFCWCWTSVGDIDAFIKTTRPDGKDEVLSNNCLIFLSGWYANGINQNQMLQNNQIQSNKKQIETPNNPQMLGLKLLDEPSAQQTDPSVLELHLRWKFKNKVIRCITLTKTIVDTISFSGWSPRSLLQGWPR